MSQQYLSALAIILVSVLKIFGIEIGNDVITSLLVGAFAVWVAIRRHAQGDITVAGVKK